MNIQELFEKHKLYCGRMISAFKRAPEDHICVWNANVITATRGKVWYGDLDLTVNDKKLKAIAAELGETLYVLQEMDCRFGTEKDTIPSFIEKAVWNTNL